MDHIKKIRKSLIAEIGSRQISELHQRNRFYDFLGAFFVFSSFISLVYYLGHFSFSFLWVFAFILQGFVIQLMGLINHDLFVHRNVGGKKISYILSLFFSLPWLSLPTNYRVRHLIHHQYIGSKKDTERYKQDLNCYWKRLFFLSPVGMILIYAYQLMVKNEGHVEMKNYIKEFLKVYHRKILLEKTLLCFYIGLLIFLTFYFPELTIYGYLLPLFVMAPIASNLRLILEHADLDPENPYDMSTYYQTGFFTRALFLWDSGDCHAIHHFFPTIPFYRMNKAIKLFNLVLLEKGVKPRHSFPRLLYGYFIKNYAHRSSWPDSV